MMDGKKTDSQAWRRKPRKFAPKSRLGCKTCKYVGLMFKDLADIPRIRQIKCDLSRPSCLKCVSTGRACDGYNAYKTEIADRGDSCDSAKCHLQNLGSFLVLPATEPAQAEAMCFFRDISIKHLNEYRPCEAWRDTLMFFSQTVPSVRHAAIALALMHRHYLDCQNDSRVYQPPALKDKLSDKTPLLHYNRAIQLLLNTGSGDTETTAVTLLVCYLFTCFDHLAGDDVQAMKHLRGGVGVALTREVDNPTLNEYTHDPQSSGVCAVIRQVTEQIRRLDMQAVMFLVDWTPANIEQKFTSIALPDSINSTFQSLGQAADYLQTLIAQVMRLRNTEQQMSPTGTMPALPSPLKDLVLTQLETWKRLFETLLRSSNSDSDSETQTDPLVPLLRLQHTTAYILLRGYGSPGREMDYDKFLPQFRQCVVLADEVAAARHRHYSSSMSTFTPEIGFIPVLYIIGAKCRHPTVRREVLRILRARLIREAAWDSFSTARVVERVIDIEEGGQVGQCMGMDQIPVWCRIETLSFIHIPGRGSPARLDIVYTFCGLEGIHTESVMIE